jgi:hypothetical protein
MVELLPVPAFTPKFGSLLLGECDAAVHLPVGANPGVRKEPNDHLVAFIPRHVLQPLELLP